MNRIIFVDDERQILDGLRDMLRKQRRKWDMVFALGAEAALLELEKGPCHVVVTDMRMPGMDGADLLRRVREIDPGIVRIVLSGHSDQERIISALPVIHQFLSKPCDPGTLESVIERTLSLQSLVSEEGVRRIVGRIAKLPSAPDLYWRLTQCAARSDAAMSDFVAIVETDPAMCAKVLQLVNSAYFGLGHQMSSVAQAIPYLGVELVKGLALSIEVFDTLGTGPCEDRTGLEAIQAHSVLTARVARRILGGSKDSANAFTAGLVHDIGKLVILSALPEGLRQGLKSACESGCADREAESRVLGTTHAEVGAYLLGMWGLPLDIVEAVGTHHRITLSDGGTMGPAAAIRAADTFVHLVGEECGPGSSAWEMAAETCASLGMPSRFDEWLEAARAECGDAVKSGGRD